MEDKDTWKTGILHALPAWQASLREALPGIDSGNTHHLAVLLVTPETMLSYLQVH